MSESFDPELAELFDSAARDHLQPEPFVRNTLLRLERTRRARVLRQAIGTVVAMSLAALAAPYAASATLEGISWAVPHLPAALGLCGVLTLWATARRIVR